jgi:hypothetical protein
MLNCPECSGGDDAEKRKWKSLTVEPRSRMELIFSPPKSTRVGRKGATSKGKILKSNYRPRKCNPILLHGQSCGVQSKRGKMGSTMNPQLAKGQNPHCLMFVTGSSHARKFTPKCTMTNVMSLIKSRRRVPVPALSEAD